MAHYNVLFGKFYCAITFAVVRGLFARWGNNVLIRM